MILSVKTIGKCGAACLLNNNNNNLFSPDLSCTHFFFVTAIAMPFYFN